jgi:sporulation protein YlmC with PRC-barrel domain
MRVLLLGTALTLIGGMPALAQDIFRPASDATMIYASEFIGMRVYAADPAVDADAYDGVQEGWNDIGEVNDFVLSRDGSVDSILIDIGGFLGIGERQVAVDMNAIRFVSDSATADNDGDFFLVLNADRAVIEGAPAYERRVLAGPGATNAAAPAAATATTDATGAATDGTATATNDVGMAADGTAPTMERDGYVAADWAQITTEDLTGVNVYGTNDESLGEISNFVLTQDNQISHVVVDVGGFLGIGTRPVAIDAADLQVMRADGDGTLRAYVSMSRDQIEQLPAADL